MTPLRIFISSVQSEFARERATLRDYVRKDPLMRRFFDVFLFEDAPASNRRPDELYLDEVERCDVYVGLFGCDYGIEDKEGISPTEREFDRATAVGAHRLVFLKGSDDAVRHPKMQALIGKVRTGLIRKRFNATEELKIGLYAALVEYLEVKALIRWGPFDAAPCMNASLDDLDFERMSPFIRTARRVRGFPLAEDASPEALLTHLNLLNNGRVTHAAVLLFGKSPQRFLLSSEIKCAHFHGTQVAKPIPSYQVYKGTVFNLIDQAVDFVLSKIALSVGTRAETVQAPVRYEIPQEVVTEAIVNAVAHRDYTSAGSVQVMLFADRLEVRNPGRLSPSLTLDDLKVAHTSVPGNPLLAESLYLAEYIERMGTGTLDMIRRCVESGLPGPEFTVTDGFVTTVWRKVVLAGEVIEQPESRARHGRGGGQARMQACSQDGVQDGVQDRVQDGVQAELEARDVAILRACAERAATKRELQVVAGYSRRTRNFEQRLERLLRENLLEMTVPDKPRSRWQKYRLSEKVRGVPDGGQDGGQDGVQDRGQDGQVELEARDVAMLRACAERATTRRDLQAVAGYSGRTRNFEQRLDRLLRENLLEMTVPDKPRSRWQKYRLSEKGQTVAAILKPERMEK